MVFIAPLRSKIMRNAAWARACVIDKSPHKLTAMLWPPVQTHPFRLFGHHYCPKVIPVRVNFSFPVVVEIGIGASPPFLSLGVSNGTRSAVYSYGSGSSALFFEYTVRKLLLSNLVSKAKLCSVGSNW